jgi:hypothetical protein
MDAAIFRELYHAAGKTLLLKLANHINKYSARNLTYEKDTVGAFRRILPRSPFHTFYGIPIAPDDDGSPATSTVCYNIGFTRGLWWAPSFDSDSLRQ